MRILFLTWYNELMPSSRSRVFQYLPHLEKLGVRYRVIVYNRPFTIFYLSQFRFPANVFGKMARFLVHRSLAILNMGSRLLSMARLLLLAPRYDIVFVQKAMLPGFCLERLRASNPAIAFDMDDALYSDQKNYRAAVLDRLCRAIRLAVVENRDTEAYFRTRGVPTLRITGPIDCERYRPRKSARIAGDDTVTIGWVGSPSTTPNLMLMENVLLRILERFPQARLLLIGAERDIPHPRSATVKWKLASEVELLSRFDIGIMPLPDDEWSRGKGGYKLLQYMALGIPSVVSPVGVNGEIQIDGETGYLATSESEWEDRLARLIADRDRVSRMGRAARARAESHFSYEVDAPLLFQGLLEMAARSRPITRDSVAKRPLEREPA